MKIVIDTSCLIAVIFSEPEKKSLEALTRGSVLLSPPSLEWEFGNALSAMFKRKLISWKEAQDAVAVYRRIPVRVVHIDLQSALRIAQQHSIYAYDAYMLTCAQAQGAPLLTLDRSLQATARKCSVNVLEV